jgi:hypothetical protein
VCTGAVEIQYNARFAVFRPNTDILHGGRRLRRRCEQRE